MRGLGCLLVAFFLFQGIVQAQEPVVSEIEKALSILEKPVKDPDRWLVAAFFAADFYKSNPRQAARYLSDAVVVAKKNDLPDYQSDALVKLSLLFRHEKKGNEYLEQAISIQRKLGNDKKVMTLSLQLAGGYLRQEQVKKAIPLYEELLPEFRKSASRQELVMALFNYGNAVLIAGDYEKALELGEVVTSISVKIPFEMMEQQGLLLQGKALQRLGQTEASLRVRNEALRKAEASRDLNLQTSALLDMAELLENLEDYPRAIPYLKRGIALGKNSDQAQKQLFLNIRMARALIQSGQAEDAFPYIEDAQELQITRKLGRKEIVQIVKGRALYESGQVGRGIDLMQRSFLKQGRHNNYVAEDRLIVANYFSEKGLYKQADEQFKALEVDLPGLSLRINSEFKEHWQNHLRRKKGIGVVKTIPESPSEAKRRLIRPNAAEKSATLRLEDSLRDAALAEQLALLSSENKRKAAELKQSEFRFYLFLMALLLLLLSAAFGLFWYRNRKKQVELLAEKEKQIRALELEEAEKQKKLEVVDALLEGQEQERKRIAESLHDEVGSMLSALRLQLERFETEEKPASEQAHLTLRKAVNMLDHVATDVRNLSHVLMPTALGKFGLKKALTLYIEQLNAAGKVHFELLITGLEKPLSENMELSSYRILLELCNNVLKHAQARNVVVQLVEHADQLVIMVEDNGKGFEPVDNSSDGIGLRTLESRIHLMQGRMEVETVTGRGTHITIELPLSTNLR